MLTRRSLVTVLAGVAPGGTASCPRGVHCVLHESACPHGAAHTFWASCSGWGLNPVQVIHGTGSLKGVEAPISCFGRWGWREAMLLFVHVANHVVHVMQYGTMEKAIAWGVLLGGRSHTIVREAEGICHVHRHGCPTITAEPVTLYTFLSGLFAHPVDVVAVVTMTVVTRLPLVTK